MSEEADAGVEYTIVGEDGTEYGPMGLEELKTLVRDNRVGPETQVLDSTTKAWHQAQQIEELSEFFAEEEAASAAPPYARAEETTPRTSTLALASMWCGIVSVPTFCCAGWVLALVAVILGLIARAEIRQFGYEGTQHATVGIVCGFANLLVTGFFALAFGPKFIQVLQKLFHQYG